MTLRRRLALGAALAAVTLVVAWWVIASRRATAWYDGDRDTWFALAEGVSTIVLERGGDAGVSTGHALFDGEWDLVTCQMAVIGLSQVALRFPEAEPRFRPARDRCLDWLVSPEARAFGTRVWGRDGLDAPLGTPGHAYLGYVGLALGLDRLVRPEPRHAALHDLLAGLFLAAMDEPVPEFQTYPGQTYPPDLATVAASVAVHARSRGEPLPDALIDWTRRFEAVAVDPATGWIHQSIDPWDGRSVYGVRGSGTAFTATWMAWVDPAFAARLHAAHRDLGLRTLPGFGAMREVPPGASFYGDVDSGPVVFGVGVSATGFALASARATGDRVTHARLHRTAHLFGVPVRGGQRFATGLGIGNAILLAMLTAPLPGESAGR